ncbi:sodium:pantothenate symporter [Halalkalicoccus jeotgali B3]|uniref:Sodium:pantothenate symporter n=1 Tax=Halalkalicoccus jeotgali (strain DSM 18796 / CECT 7217 / JCM 14584 / KCTC 4019 / B3) TaxID=795797 RepID=D8J782_HALJB|nr:sodium:solute symporter family protein [Halalkalicoccus jeotgali]ADJ13977.1 sodium:pantothenate symporter [Halalkalicoccus jeotgali B3]
MQVEPQEVSLGWEIAVLTVLGLALMIFIGWYSYNRRVGVDVDDFFSASKSLGFLIIGLTIFADSYSGNSFLGYAAETYRSGAWFLVYPQFMVAAVIGSLIVAPPLINLGLKWDYTSPIDYLEHRFDSRVAFLAVFFLLWGTFLQFTEQFFAMGYLGNVASGGVLPYQLVIVLFAVVILLYVGLGGFRGTALTAAVQGTLMLFSLSLMLLLIGMLDGFTAQMETVWQQAPEKLTLPDTATMRGWYSTIVLILLGLPTYIHIQQFYLGVRDAEDLRSTFRLQAPVFFFAAITLWIIGMFASGVFPGLSQSQSEQVVPYLLGAFVQLEGSTLLPSLIALGVIMATLSTAGATVMVVSMVLAKDLYGRFIDPNAPDGQVINVSRVFLALSLVVALGIAFRPSLTIWTWTELKFEFLLQATPLFVFGLYTHRVKNTPAIAGMLVGCAVAIALYLTGNPEVYSFHAGIIGLIANSAVFLGGSFLSGQDAETERAKRILEYNSIAVANAEDERDVRYVLPAETKSFWIGLTIIVALMVPWYAPAAWNARLAFGLPIWTWVIIGALVLETLFVVFSTYIWRPKGPTSSGQDAPHEEETTAD